MITTPQARFILEDGDDVTTTRVFVFPVYDKDEVIVRRIAADGSLSAVMTEGVDYEITLTAPPAAGGPHLGGTIEFTTAATSTQQDYAYSSTPVVQNVKVTTTTTTYNMGLERNALDPIVFMIQELNDRVGRIAGVDNPAYGFPLLPDPVGNNGKVLYVADDAYTLVDIFDGSEIFLSNAAAGRLAMFSGADSFDGLPNVTYVDGTKTLKIKGSAVAADKSVQFLDSGDVVVGSFRSDGQIIDDTDLTTKLYVDDGIVVAISGTEADAAATYVPLSSGVRSLAQSAGVVTVGNTALETTLLSFTLPGGSLGTNRAVRIRMFGKWSHDGDGTNSCVIRLKYGATTVFTGSAALLIAASPVSDQVLIIEMELRANNSAAAQIAHSWFSIDTDDFNRRYSGDETEDSTADKVVAVTAQWDTADSSETVSLASEAILI